MGLLFILQGWCFLKYFLPYCLAPCCLRFPFSFPSCPLWQLISSPWPFSSVLGRLFSLGRSSFPSTASVPSLCLDSHTSNPRPHFPLSTTFGEPSSELTPPPPTSPGHTYPQQVTLLSFLCTSPLSAAQTLFFIALLLPSHPEHDGPVPPPEGS